MKEKGRKEPWGGGKGRKTELGVVTQGCCGGWVCGVYFSPTSFLCFPPIFFESLSNLGWDWMDRGICPGGEGWTVPGLPAAALHGLVSLDEAHRGPWELWPSSCLYISGRGPSRLGARLFPFASQAWRLGSKKRRRDLLLLGKMKSAAASPSFCPTRAENPGEPNQGFCKCQRALSYSKYSPVKISEMIYHKTIFNFIEV